MKKTLYLCFLACFSLVLFGTKAHAQYTITSTSVSHECDSDMFYVAVSSYSVTTLTVHSYFGDGTTAIHPVTDSFGYVYFGHTYTAPGLYSVKHVLYNSLSPIDSVIGFDTARNCRIISLTAYLDNNSDCLFDLGDDLILYPMTIQIDSNGYPIDTITATSIFYEALGPSGTIYKFTLLTPPSGLTVSCPSTGIVSDTIGTSSDVSFMGFECSSSTGFDLAEVVHVGGPGRHMSIVDAEVTNAYCTAHDATLTMTFSPKYNFTSAVPAPTTVAGNVITWYFPAVSEVSPKFVSALFQVPGTWLTPGDTIHSSYVVTPITGDLDTTNNTIVRIDTVKISYDPNEKAVEPAGFITPGTNLNYNIKFENTGNAPAVNIHVQDTLPNSLDISSFKLVSSTAPVYTYFSKDAMGHNVIKFDFPNINLLDSSHHGLCDGMVSFTINAKTGLAAGTVITNDASIYFDENTPVMTDTTWNEIGATTAVATISNVPGATVYPNPVNGVLTVRTTTGAFTSLTIANIMGQTVMTQAISTSATTVDVQSLPSGVYYIMLKGDNGTKVQKFEKL